MNDKQGNLTDEEFRILDAADKRVKKITKHVPITGMYILCDGPENDEHWVRWGDIKDRLIPDEWPGVYPDEDGIPWYFETHTGFVVTPTVFADEHEGDCKGMLFFICPITGRFRYVRETKPKQWGPRVPMVRP